MDTFAGVRAEARNTLAEEMRIADSRKNLHEDGKLRIATLTTGGIQVGLSFIGYAKGRVIDDPVLINTLEKAGVPFEILTGAAPLVLARKPKGPVKKRVTDGSAA